jgi:16S rRNA (cytosine967-C5)-methyltransferase
VRNLGQASKAKKSSSGISPARLAALEILNRVESEGAYASILLATRENDLNPKDRALSHELTLGVLRRQLFFDHLIAHYANRDPSRLDQAVRNVLRLGLYQLRFLTRIPPAAAVNDAVKLVRHARVSSADKFVNAVLRRAIREAEYDPVSGVEDPLEQISIETSHPRWLIDRWANAFGLPEAAAFAKSNNEAAPVSFRITNRAADEVLDELIAAGATLTRSELVKDAWRISGGTSALRQLAQRGEVYLQDEASQLVAQALQPQSANRILDLCAAPGSKTTHLASLSPNAIVVASDLHEHRLRTVSQNASLQGLANVCPLVLDGLAGLPFETATFDCVLVDAPCSGTGTLRHNPEIRWRISAGDIKELAGRQQQLLQNVARVLKPRSRLVYSTCSIEKEENEQVVEAFLAANSSFRRAALPVDSRLITESGSARTWPHRQGTDGFFITAFERKEYGC